MYTKEELKQLKKEFWEAYGMFCRNLPEMAHRKDNFLLNTKMKGVEFKYDANREGAYVILEINLKDENERLKKYEQFEKYKAILEAGFPEGLIWDFVYTRECGSEVCRIYSHKDRLDIHRRSDWMDFFRFLSSQMLKLEEAFLMIKDAIK